MKKQAFTIRTFKCPICGTIRQATKKASRKTSTGHLKDMWCFKCGCERKFIQVE